MSEQVQQLNYEAIVKASEKYEETREVIVKLEVEGMEVPFKVEMYKELSPVGVKDCVIEFINQIDKINKKAKIDATKIMTPYLMFLMIKHFTTLKLPEKFEEQLVAISKMIESGALIQIYLNFEAEQIELIEKEVESIIETFKMNEQHLNALREKHQDEFETIKNR